MIRGLNLKGIRNFCLFRSKMSSMKGQQESNPNAERLIWIDLEMTGLNVESNKIMEAACAITDSNLNIVAKAPTIIINVSDDILNKMDDWCTKHHGDSGLTDACKKSKTSLQEAEMTLLSFVRQHTVPHQCPIAGNSVHADKKFLEKYMPELCKHFHYRIVDVSTVKELCRRWYPKEFSEMAPKKLAHRALDDIVESIEELKYYRKKIFKSPTQ